MGLSFFVALCSILILCKSLITPTIINITGEYYINSQSTSFIRNTITCTTSTCIILCDIIDGCFETIIDASASTTLILRCLEYQSCKQANLINGPSNLAELHCLKYSACKNANFSTQNTSNVNIECNHVDCVSGCVSSTVPGVCRGATFNAEFANIVDVQCIGESGDCFEAIFNVNNADTVKFKAMKSYALNEAQIIGGGITNALIIDCSDTYTCFRVNIYCPQNAACNINCTDSRNECYFGIIYIPTQNYSTLNLLCDSGACDSMQFTCQDTEDVSDLIWAAGYVCLTNDCCPTELQRPISILDCDVLFANGTECVIDCSDYGGCPFKTYINGSRSNSLTLNCDGNYECKYIDVYCPYNGECNINCLGSFSCEYMNIKKETIASLSLNCLGTPSHSCKGINVDVMVSNTVLISCTGGSYSCLHGVFDIDGIAGVTNMNIEIEGHSAFNGDAYFSNINEINISCNGVKACGPDIFASNIGSLDVYCIGYRSCPSFDWNVETEDFMVHCLGDSSCIYMNLMANITNSLSITTTNNTAFANSVITVDCMDCLNTYNCMENITLYCGANETQYIIEEADNCRNCECDTMLTTNTFIPYENNIWQQCTPTPQPTTDPTMEPTVEPTTNPTFNPTLNPTINPTLNPTLNPTTNPTFNPTTIPTMEPTFEPTNEPTVNPTSNPTNDPTNDPTVDPTHDPTVDPTTDPTHDPTVDPTIDPTHDPTVDPTIDPTTEPTPNPTFDPTIDPTTDPTHDPTHDPTTDPTHDPTNDPTTDPTTDPTIDPTSDPTHDPTVDPTTDPTLEPTPSPTFDPTSSPTDSPIYSPTDNPSYSPS
eukprot:311445_1